MAGGASSVAIREGFDPLHPIGRYQSLHLPLGKLEQGRSCCRTEVPLQNLINTNSRFCSCVFEVSVSCMVTCSLNANRRG